MESYDLTLRLDPRIEVAALLQLLPQHLPPASSLPSPTRPGGCLLWLGPADLPEHERRFEDLAVAMLPGSAVAKSAPPLCSVLQEGPADGSAAIAQAVSKTLAKRYGVQVFVSVDHRLLHALSGVVASRTVPRRHVPRGAGGAGTDKEEGEGEGEEEGVLLEGPAALLPTLLRTLLQALDDNCIFVR